MIYDFDATKARDFIEKLMDRTYGRGKRKGKKVVEKQKQEKQEKIEEYRYYYIKNGRHRGYGENACNIYKFNFILYRQN